MCVVVFVLQWHFVICPSLMIERLRKCKSTLAKFPPTSEMLTVTLTLLENRIFFFNLLFLLKKILIFSVEQHIYRPDARHSTVELDPEVLLLSIRDVLFDLIYFY